MKGAVHHWPLFTVKLMHACLCYCHFLFISCSAGHDAVLSDWCNFTAWQSDLLTNRQFSSFPLWNHFQDGLHEFPRLFTDTSEHIHFSLFLPTFFSFWFCATWSVFEHMLKHLVSYHILPVLWAVSLMGCLAMHTLGITSFTLTAEADRITLDTFSREAYVTRYFHLVVLTNLLLTYTVPSVLWFCLQCFDAVGWVAGRTRGL